MTLIRLADLLADHAPTSFPDEARLGVFRELDRILLDDRLTSEGGRFDVGGPGRSPDTNPLKELYEHQIRKALSEIATTRADGAIVVWQLYNMGYVFSTPEVTFGTDVVGGPVSHDWRWTIPEDIVTGLADCMDLLLVTHSVDNYHTHPSATWYHTDHCDHAIVDRILQAGKPVLVPTGHERFLPHYPQIVLAGHHQSYGLLGLHITSYGGRHAYQDNPFDTPHVLYEVMTPSNDKVFFTGDDDDAFFLGMQRFKSRVVVAGHLGELTHPPGGGRESYLMACDIYRQLLGNTGTQVVVTFWGEEIVVPVGR